MPLRRPRRKAVLIGLDAAMLEYFDRYIAEGALPEHRPACCGRGPARTPAAPRPPATSVNWNTIATGCLRRRATACTG